MELLFSCLVLFLISIGAGKLLSKVMGQRSTKFTEAEEASVFLKKYKEVDVDSWKTTIQLSSFATALGVLLLSAETIKRKTGRDVDEKIVDVLDEGPTDWVEPDVEIYTPPEPKVEVPPPPKPPLPVIIDEVDVKIEDPKPIETPEPLNEPLPPMPMPTPIVKVNNVPKPTISPPPIQPVVEVEKDLEKIIFDFAEEMPKFEGGIDELRKQIGKNYKVPRGFEGKGVVVTRFVVLEDGSIGDIQIYSPIPNCETCSEEAIKAIRKVKGQFSPGKQAGKPVKVWFTLPIVIEIR